MTESMSTTSRRSPLAAAFAACALAFALPASAFADSPSPSPNPKPKAKAAKPAPPAPTPVATPVPAASPTPSPQARARAAFDTIAKGTFDRTQLTQALSAELTAARLAGYAQVLGPLGAPASFTLVGSHDLGGTTTYDYVVRYKEGAVAFAYGIDDATQRVSKLYIRTART